MFNLKRWQLAVAIIALIGGVMAIAIYAKTLWPELFKNGNAPESHVIGPCVPPPQERMSANAYWVHNSFEAYNRQEYDDAIRNVNECLGNWQPLAKIQQDAADARNEAQPPKGIVDQATMQRVVSTDALIHDVGASLWILGRSHHQLGHQAEARQAYTTCTHFTRARVWDPPPHGWLWAPAEDCTAQLGELDKSILR